MLQQSMTILSALAFVLSLVWVAVWFAKRYGVIAARPRARVAVEVVQRVSIGPKTGLAVVRVGEKVMAVSMGPDGLRALFELDECDRQRIIASSDTPSTAMAAIANTNVVTQPQFAAAAAPQITAIADVAQVDSTTVAATSASRVTPPATERVVTNVLPPSLKYVLPTAVANMFQRETFVTPTSFAETMQTALNQDSFNPNSTSVNTLPQTVSAGEREFHSMLNMTLSGATRLAVFGGIALLSAMSATNTVSAQATPPTNPPAAATTPVTTPTTQTADPQNTVQPTAPAAATVNAPKAPKPAFVVPSSTRPAAVRPAVTRSQGATSTAPPQQPPARTAAQVEADKRQADSIRASSRAKAGSTVIPGSASRSANKSNAAAPAPVAGGDEALANMLPQMDLKMGDGKDGGLRLSGTVGIVVMMGLLTLVPTLVLMMTGFTRILIVLHFLKQAMGTQSAPPAQLLAAMALLLTGFVMAPTLTEVNKTALEPWMNGKVTQVEMLKVGVKPFREFMLKQTKEKDLKTFVELSRLPRPNNADDVPLHVLMSAFVASELRTSFQIGFMIYLPFIIIDAVVASVLMSMGMFMLPPAMISMPFKLLLFVLVDGWGLIIQQLVKSFNA